MKKTSPQPAEPLPIEEPVQEPAAEAAEPAPEPMPQSGGSYVRMPDGTLRKEGED